MFREPTTYESSRSTGNAPTLEELKSIVKSLGPPLPRLFATMSYRTERRLREAVDVVSPGRLSFLEYARTGIEVVIELDWPDNLVTVTKHAAPPTHPQAEPFGAYRSDDFIAALKEANR